MYEDALGPEAGEPLPAPPTRLGVLTELLFHKQPSWLFGTKALSPALLHGGLLQSIHNIAELFPWQQRKGLFVFLRGWNLFNQKVTVGSGSQSALHPLPLLGCRASFAVLEF